MPRKKITHDLSRESIMQTARVEFVQKGFQQVSMRGIAKLLGCSHGAIYYHFKNKAELFYGIVETDFSRLNQQLDEIINETEKSDDKLYRVLIQFIKFGLNHQSQYEMMFMLRNTEVDSLSQTAANQSYQKFAETVQFLSSKPLKIKDIWSAFIALHGFVSHYRGYVEDFEEVRAAAESHVTFIIRGLLD